MSKDNLDKMKGLDLYLSSLTKKKQEATSSGKAASGARPPLVSWDIYAQAYQTRLNDFDKNKDREALNVLKTKYSWVFNFDGIDWQNTHYQAIVVTDVNLKIVHASPGFVGMTGYSVKEAIGQSPKFLQGADTSQEIRLKIREAITKGKPITASLVNYRKNGEEYNCQVKIQPLYNHKNNITHFIAFEQEVA